MDDACDVEVLHTGITGCSDSACKEGSMQLFPYISISIIGYRDNKATFYKVRL